MKLPYVGALVFRLGADAEEAAAVRGLTVEGRDLGAVYITRTGVTGEPNLNLVEVADTFLDHIRITRAGGDPARAHSTVDLPNTARIYMEKIVTVGIDHPEQ